MVAGGGAAVDVVRGGGAGVEGVVEPASTVPPHAAARSGSAAIAASRACIAHDFGVAARTPTDRRESAAVDFVGASGIISPVSLFAVVLLACALVVIVAAEWPRLDERIGGEARRRRERAKRKRGLKVIRSDTDDFAASVQRDLANLPTIEEREERR